MEEKLHRKRAYSQRVIRKAFLELLAAKPIAKITVKEICERADVNRTTFYANYADPYALLSSIKEELFETIKTSVEESLSAAQGKITLEEVLKTIYENMDICKIILTLPDYEFARRILNIAYERTHEIKPQKAAEDPERFDYLFEYQASGCLGILKKWISEGLKQPYTEIADYIQAFTDLSLNPV